MPYSAVITGAPERVDVLAAMPQPVVEQHDRQHRLGGVALEADARVVALGGDDVDRQAGASICAGMVMLEVGFSDVDDVTAMEMLPRMPPALLLVKPCGVNSSRCWLPFCSPHARPRRSRPLLTALMPIIA